MGHIHGEIKDSSIRSEVNKASARWRAGFNNANPQECANQYHENAVMEVGGIGSFAGKAEIYKFWQEFISSGAREVEYFKTKIEVIDENTALLTSDWKMNVGLGVITKEKWCRQNNGQWLLTEDAFEMTEKFN